jgi:DnaJ like chaperone protein
MFVRRIPICVISGFFGGLFYGGNALSIFIGCVVGGFCDFLYRNLLSPRQEENIAQQNFSLALTSLAAKIAKANGTVSAREVASFKKHTSFIKTDYKIIGLIFNNAGIDSVGYETYIAQLRAFFFAHPIQKINSLKLLYNVAYADGIKNNAQLNILQTCAFQWGLNQEQINDIEASIEIPKPS